MELPNEIIQCILEMAELPIDSRLAFNIKPKKVIVPDGLSEHIQELNNMISWNFQHQNMLLNTSYDSFPSAKCVWIHENLLGYDPSTNVCVFPYIKFEYEGEIYSTGTSNIREEWFNHSTRENVHLWDQYRRKERIAENRKRFPHINRYYCSHCKLSHGNNCVCGMTNYDTDEDVEEDIDEDDYTGAPTYYCRGCNEMRDTDENIRADFNDYDTDSNYDFSPPRKQEEDPYDDWPW
jgi:hypothetical protein